MIEKIMVAGNGVRLRHPTTGIFVQNLKDPRTDFMDM